MEDPLVESKIAEAAHAAGVAKEAEHNALVEALSTALVPILQKALTYGGNDRPALVARIPVICNDIRDMKISLVKQDTNLYWIRWLLVGICTGIGLLALRTLGVVQ